MTWTTSDAAQASVDPGGLVKGTAPGATITATVDGKAGNAVRVSAPTGAGKVYRDPATFQQATESYDVACFT